MDAITYLKTKARMTDSCNKCCNGCPLDRDFNSCIDDYDPEKGIAIVEKWLAEHPVVTYASKMREVFPEFRTGHACLADLLGTNRDFVNCGGIRCPECWNREYGSLEGRKEK